MLGCIAVQSVYTPEGRIWLDELLEILEKNMICIKEFLEEHLPTVTMHLQKSTYLAWLDFRQTNLSWEEIERKMEEEAKVVLDPGSKFGEAGRGFMRINIACPSSTLEKALTRIKNTY